MINKYKSQEYLITNGLGGFSSGTVLGPKSRKYQGVLNASLEAPIKRHLLISDLKTHVLTNNKSYILECKTGQDCLENFDGMIHPTFDYKIHHVTVKKTIAMVHLENTTTVIYDIKTQDQAATIQAEIFSNFRDHHDLIEDDFIYPEINIQANKVKLSHPLSNVYVLGFGSFNKLETWSEPIQYEIETRRGQPDTERQYSPGYFEITLAPWTEKRIGIVFSTENKGHNFESILEKSTNRLKKIMANHSKKEQILRKACDQFIVYRKSTHAHSVIAGYPWFTDWGRDTMIALRGLTLSTNRYDLAKSILETFLNYERDGLIPNMFPDENSSPMYNTIDGTLWLFVALYDYYQASQDGDFIRSYWTKLNHIINKHIKGTLYHIKVDTDGLLSGGDASTQLTWMDVKIDGIVVTPRHGKAVEINSLWFNALSIMSYFSKELALKSEINFDLHAKKCHESFNLKFWNEKASALYDVIQNGIPIDRMRPNQIFAVSLPFSLLDKDKEKHVVDQVTKYLLTPFGLRSLSQDHPEYIGQYDGDVYKRDFAYHQGTVWGWLMGPYLEAHYKVYQDSIFVNKQLDGLLNHLDDTGIGTLSEVFYGNPPHYPRGCFAQAWTVSEAMRIYNIMNKSS